MPLARVPPEQAAPGAGHTRSMNMRLIAVLMIGVLSLPAAASPPDFAPGWTLKTPDGATVTYPDDAEGNPSVLLFWPSWCPYSRALQPYVQDIWRDYADAGVKVWTINIRENGDPVAAMRERDLHFPLLLHGDGLMLPYGITRSPWFIVVAGDGRIVYTRPPSPPTPIDVAKDARKALNALLGARAVPLPERYPPPYDLHVRDGEQGRGAAAPDALPASEWLPWVQRYLAALPEQGPDVPAVGPVRDGRSAIDHARTAWTARHGAEAVRSLAPFRSFMRKGVWVAATVGGDGLGAGLIYAVDREDGRVRAIEDRRGSRAARQGLADVEH